MEKNRNKTCKEIAKIFGYTETWIRMLAKAGKIPASRKGRQLLFSEEEVRNIVYTENKPKDVLAEL